MEPGSGTESSTDSDGNEMCIRDRNNTVNFLYRKQKFLKCIFKRYSIVCKPYFHFYISFTDKIGISHLSEILSYSFFLRMIPVSYTHLKSFMTGTQKNGKKPRKQSEALINRSVKSWNQKVINIIGWIISVSYTHLDLRWYLPFLQSG